MKTVDQVREIKEVHNESLDYIRLGESYVATMLTTKINNRKPTYDYKIVDGKKWDAKLATAIKNKRPFSKLVEEMGVDAWLIPISDDDMENRVRSVEAHYFHELWDYFAKKIFDNNDIPLSALDKVVFEFALDGDMNSKLYKLDNMDHSFQDLDGNYISQFVKIPHVDDEWYNLKDLVDACREHPSMYFRLPDRTILSEYPEFKSIPGYNSEYGVRTTEVDLFWLPSDAEIQKYMKTRDYLSASDYDNYNFLKKNNIIDIAQFRRSDKERRDRETQAYEDKSNNCSYGCSCCY